jgi:radical SAM protein with 4Fe4S-binding SPASM domain
MHPRFFDMIELARSRGVRVSFITNGSYFTPGNVDRLLSGGGVEKITISLESADSSTFQEIRGAKFEKVVAGIDRLIKERKRRGLDRPVVGFSVTLLRRTAGHLPAISKLYHRLGLDGGVTAQPLQQMSAYRSAYDAAMMAEALDADEVDHRMWDFLTQSRALQRRRKSVQGFYDVLMAGWRPSSRRCPWLDKGLYVDRNGMVMPCCMVKDETHALGRIEVDSTESIQARRAKMRTELKNGVTPAACQGCEIARYAVMGPIEFVGRVVKAGLRVLQDTDSLARCPCNQGACP